MKRMIFHVPIKIDRERASASQIRPIKMINAFEKCGYKVDVVEGYGQERKKLISKIKDNITKGEKYDFLYSESSTMPTLLTEKNHFPLYPFLDFSFFSFCKRHGIKIGLFYRDIYWCFLKEQKDWKQKIARYFYQYDLKKYVQLVDIFFLPSLEMLEHIPFHFSGKVEELPSGLDLNIDNREKTCNDKVNLLYIGGIGEYYNLEMIVKIVSEIPIINFTICCRKDEWERIKQDYEIYLSDNISIVHKAGKELVDLYCQTDLFCLFMKPFEYRNFAAPFKLFEAIGFGCPIFSSEGTWVSQFVKKNEVGFVCDYNMEKLKDQLIDIVNHPNKLLFYKDRTKEIAIENTWQARSCKISNLLLGEK